MAVILAATFAGAAARAAEPPGYELNGYPITRHQISVVGTEDVSEQAPVPTLMLGGMPASPSQVMILTPRPRMTSMATVANPTTVAPASK